MSVNGICLKRRSCYLEQAEACPATSAMNIGRTIAFKFNADVILALWMRTNQNALQPLYLNFTFAFVLLEWKCTFIFHIIIEEPRQHVRSFTSQNLKFAGQEADDRHYSAGLHLSGRKLINRLSFWRNCGTASVDKGNKKIWCQTSW